jgi:hypothetical protein
VADVAVVVKASGQNSFVVGDDFGAQGGQNFFKCLGAQTAVAFGQRCVGNFFSNVFVHATIFLKPFDQSPLIFLFHKLLHDRILLSFTPSEPDRPKKLFLGQHGAGAVAFEFGALFVLQVELPRKAEQLLNLGEAAFAVDFQRMDQLVTL